MSQTRTGRRARRVTVALLAGGALSAGVAAVPAWAPTCGTSCGMSPPPVHPPTSKAQCKDDGWQTFLDAHGDQAFRNQGDCVSFVETGR